MALNTLPQPLGVDYFVNNLTTGLYNRLVTVWGVSSTTYAAFPRIYRNYYKDNGYIPEWYSPASGGYVDGKGNNTSGGLFFEDTLAALSYFVQSDPQRGNKGKVTSFMQLLFFVDLSKITPNGLTAEQQAGQRCDEIAINDVRNYIQSNGSNFTVHEVYRDVDKVTERFSGKVRQDVLKRDMHPFLCFRIDLELNYNPLLNKQVPQSNSFLS